MDDPRGGFTTETNHEVKTLKKAREWYSEVLKEHLPILVCQNKTSNGRVHIQVFDRWNNRIFTRG